MVASKSFFNNCVTDVIIRMEGRKDERYLRIEDRKERRKKWKEEKQERKERIGRREGR